MNKNFKNNFKMNQILAEVLLNREVLLNKELLIQEVLSVKLIHHKLIIVRFYN